MIEFLEKYYEKCFHNNKNNLNIFLLAETYLNRYQYRIGNVRMDRNLNKICVDILINNDNTYYDSIYGIIELTEDNIYIEVDKEIFDGSCCIFEHINIKDNSFSGNVCDFGFYNANVLVIENNQRQEHVGKICETSFNEIGIIDVDDLIIPYDSDSYKDIMDEVIEFHNLSKEEIAETFDFGNYKVQSLIINEEDSFDVNDYIDFGKSYRMRRGRRK